LGELEAQAHDLELRLRESVAREQRLVELASRSEAVAEELRRNDREMRARIERYSRFHEDLEHSRIWRLIQAVRRLFGREW
jgi:hypothetical protein